MKSAKLAGKALFLLAALCVFVGAADAADYDFNFHTYPNPFFAGEAQLSQQANVAFNLPNYGTVSIRIYDFEGNLVRTLVPGDRLPPGKYGELKGYYIWDGRDDNYDVVARGPYVIVFEVTIEGKIYRDTFVAIAKR